jgi:PKHD-type hydroxylase
MLIRIPNVLTPAQVDAGRKMLEAADWTDGKATAGPLTKSSKNNMQVPSATRSRAASAT